MRTRSAVLSTCLALGAGLLAGPPAVAASAPEPSCGSVVRGHVVLSKNLVCRGSRVGLVVADGATLDLGGHRVVGDGTGTGIRFPGYGDVTIRNGVVRGWTSGLALDTVDISGRRGTTTLESLVVRDSTTGLEVMGIATPPPHVEVDDSRFVGNDVGIRGHSLWGDGKQLAVSSSRFTDNRVGIAMTFSRVTAVDSVFAHNGTGLTCSESDCGLVESTLRDNGTAVRTTWYGGFDIRRSTIARNDVGIDSYNGPSVPSVLDSTVLRDNGIALELSAAHAVVTHNRFVRNDVGFAGVDSPLGGEGTGRYASELEGNEFRRNGDGVLSVAYGTTLKLNTAIRNERWGIHAPGAVDLGGNTARRNGNSPQCVGVDCGESGPRS